MSVLYIVCLCSLSVSYIKDDDDDDDSARGRVWSTFAKI